MIAPDPADPCPEISDEELLERAIANCAKGMLDGLRMAGMDDVEIALFLLTPASERVIVDAQVKRTGTVVIEPVFIRTRVAQMVAQEHQIAKADATFAQSMDRIDFGPAH